jgi:hypothetical protein
MSSFYKLLSMFIPPPYFAIVDFNYEKSNFFHPSLVFLDSKLFLQPFVSLTFAFDCSYME